MLTSLNKLIRYPEKVPCDKRIHFMVGTICAFILAITDLSLPTVVFSLIAIAWGIEVYQKTTNSDTYDNLDAIAVLLGAVPIILLKLF